MTVEELIDQAEERFNKCGHWQTIGGGPICKECESLATAPPGPKLYCFAIGKGRREVFSSAIVEKPQDELMCSAGRGYYWYITVQSSKGLRDAAKRAIEKADGWRNSG